MRRYGDPIQQGISYRRRPGAYGLIVKGRQVLLALNESPGEEVVFPGGGIDPGESPIQALHREVMEETGWRIAVKRRLGFYHRQIFMPEYGFAAHKVCHIYLCIAGRQVAEPTEPDHQPVLADLEVAQTVLSLEAERAFLDLLRYMTFMPPAGIFIGPKTLRSAQIRRCRDMALHIAAPCPMGRRSTYPG